MSGDVFSYSEDEGIASELVTVAEDLAGKLGGEHFSIEFDEMKYSKLPGKVMLVKSDQRITNDPELVTLALTELVHRKSPSIFLIGMTRLGREIASRLSIRLRVGSLVDVHNLKIEDGRLIGERSVFAGRFSAKVITPMPCIVSPQAGNHPRKEGLPSLAETLTIKDLGSKIDSIETRQKLKTFVDLKSASVIVSAGRGIKQKGDLALLEELARAMGGALGCSRPLSSDLGWLGEECHIGLTGLSVHPDLYLAVGISGQLQHVAGIKESRIIAAINKDKQAPIFQVADYGIIGDLYKVIPAMLKILEKI
jgi:electron transfer flavoprotein alpha subunit